MDPLIRTTPPGPHARSVLERDAKVISQSMAREYPPFIDRAEGMNLWEVDGNRYLDFSAVGGGLSLGVTLSSDGIMSWPPGDRASTFGGNSAACAAGLAVLDILGEEGFGERVKDQGRYLLKKFESLRKKHELIGDVRGMGLMIGMELVEDWTSRKPAKSDQNAVLNEAFRNGLTMLPAGESQIRFCPPLIIEREDIDTGVAIRDQALETVSAEHLSPLSCSHGCLHDPLSTTPGKLVHYLQLHPIVHRRIP